MCGALASLDFRWIDGTAVSDASDTSLRAPRTHRALVRGCEIAFGLALVFDQINVSLLVGWPQT